MGPDPKQTLVALVLVAETPYRGALTPALNRDNQQE